MFAKRLTTTLVHTSLLTLAFVITGSAIGRADSSFDVAVEKGSLTQIKSVGDTFDTNYLRQDGRLGGVVLRYKQDQDPWSQIRTDDLVDSPTTLFEENPDRSTNKAVFQIHKDGASVLTVETSSEVTSNEILWSATVRNDTSSPLRIGDLSLPLPMHSDFSTQHPGHSSVFKHSFISGHGSFLYWMRSNSVGPYLMLTPTNNTRLEYWENHGEQGFHIFFHSEAAFADAAERGGTWRQPTTGLTLAAKGKPTDTKTFSLKFQWAENYDDVRRILIEEGLIDVHVVPGMVVPNDLAAKFALRTNEPIKSIEAEFPHHTSVQRISESDDTTIYQVKFSRLGENRLTVNFGDDKQTYLEFFCTEPIETLIKKRGAFIASHQIRDESKWYDGLLCEWNMETQVMLDPSNYDRIRSWRIYEITCDDPGLSKPAFLASKNAEYPVQSEVEALDYYIEHFVWGGLQQTTSEPYPYGIYGILDWKRNRESSDPGPDGRQHMWRVYDYPHIALMYYGMYKIASRHPEIETKLPAEQYLQRAARTAIAMFTVPDKLVGWSAYYTGLYNELAYVELIEDLENEGLTADAQELRSHWEAKVRHFVNDNPNLFGSEYPFDSTGFESTHALATYALRHPNSLQLSDPNEAETSARRFLDKQMAANVFCRGWIEPTYYHLGSDYRQQAGDTYTLSYMSQMGGWAVLDYALHHASDPYPYARLGYASYLSSWALMNTGTPDSNYGYWYPGKANDGAAGGGFEPASRGHTWLGQPHHRGSWYYSCEEDLGFCGALRMAATVVTQDPIFGMTCLGGELHTTDTHIEAIPKDGIRRRFHAIFQDRTIDLSLKTRRFATGFPIRLELARSEIQFELEPSKSPKGECHLNIAGLASGRYVVETGGTKCAEFDVQDDRLIAIALENVPGNATSFTITPAAASSTE